MEGLRGEVEAGRVLVAEKEGELGGVRAQLREALEAVSGGEEAKQGQVIFVGGGGDVFVCCILSVATICILSFSVMVVGCPLFLLGTAGSGGGVCSGGAA